MRTFLHGSLGTLLEVFVLQPHDMSYNISGKQTFICSQVLFPQSCLALPLTVQGCGGGGVD